MLTKTDSSHQAMVVVVMLKESDLMSHTVIGAEAFGCFCQRAEHSDWAGLCSERTGSRPRDRGVKGEVPSWKYRAWDRKGRRMGFWGLGNQRNVICKTSFARIISLCHERNLFNSTLFQLYLSYNYS